MQRSTQFDDEPLYFANRSWILQFQGRFQEALAHAQTSLTMRERPGRESGQALAHSLHTLAYVYWGLGQPDQAGIYSERAMQIYDAPGPDPERRIYWSIETRLLLAEVEQKKGRIAEARPYREEAVRRAELMFGDAPLTARTLYALGRQSEAEGDLTGALERYRRAAAIQVRNRAVRGTIRSLDVDAYIDCLFRAAAASPDQAPALHAEMLAAAQIPREPETAKALQQMSARVAAGTPALAAVVRDIQDAGRRRDRLRGAVAAESLKPADQRLPAAQAERFARELREAGERMEALEQRLQAQFPLYAQFVADTPVTGAELSGLLRDDEALLSFLVLPRSTVVFVTRKSGVYARRLPIGPLTIRRDVEAVRRSVEVKDGAVTPFHLAAAHRLHTRLIAPIADRLAGIGHLVVAPGGSLQSLPFGLLVTKPATAVPDGDYRGVSWLGRDLAITVVPSIRAFRRVRSAGRGGSAPQPFIGFGDPAFGGAAGSSASMVELHRACREEAGVEPRLLAGLARLPETVAELRQMARTLGADAAAVVTGADATEKRVRATDLSQYRVVAFATHGLLPGELRCQGEPALALTPPATAGERAADGLLDASEVMQLHLNADWVVLSACNTADPDGKLGGESLSGLTGAFIYAGARAVLATHWAIASRPTVALTTGALGVYAREPARGKAEALRRAQRALAGEKETSHPFFWAPFVLVGDGGAIATP